MRKALVVGGTSGIGLAIALMLMLDGYQHINIIGKDEFVQDSIPEEMRDEFNRKTSFYRLDLTNENYSLFDEISDIDTLIITAGFGRVTLFENLSETEISKLIKCNELAAVQIIRKYYNKIKSDEDFRCAVLVSIAGHIVSPLFSVYGASKSALASFIESINIELEAEGIKNRILDVSPGSIKGTAFSGKKSDIPSILPLARDIVTRMDKRETLYIPQYDEIFKNVIERYHENPREYGLQSYGYKKSGGRINNESPIIIGYLSGTFDLFHIGHLNLLRRAKEQCDYLIVSVHDSGAWKGKKTFIPYDERKEILSSIRYVDLVVQDYKEDADAWSDYHYNKLFVGSDYYGTERFKKYEEFFADKNVQIVYFPYTKGTSSTQLRDALSDKIEKK